MQPLTQADSVVQAAYDHFDKELFGGFLPGCRVYFQASADRRLGFSPGLKRGASGSEIVLHLGYFLAVPPARAMQVLVHEMVHLWQFHFGTPDPYKGHNLEFAAKSEAIGLMPTSTGGVRGSRVGPRMIDYVIHGGKFERAVFRVGAMWEAVFPPGLEVAGEPQWLVVSTRNVK